MMKRNSEYLKLLLFFTATVVFGTFSGSVLPVHFLNSGITLPQMAIADLIIYVAHLSALLTIRRFKAKLGFMISTILAFTQLMLLVHISSVEQFYLASIISGLSVHFIFTPYNIAYSHNTHEDDVGISSGIMFSLPRLIGIVVPLIAGYVLGVNSTILWVVSGLLTLISLATIPAIKDFTLSYTVKGAIQATKSLRTFLVLQGIWESLCFVVIPVYTLTYIQKPEEFGAFVAYIGLAGVIANLTLGKLTDRIKKRSVFLYPVTFILAVVTFAFPLFQTSLWGWLVVAGVSSFFLPLFWNLTYALVIDNTKDHARALPGREILLDVGRVIGMSAIALSFIYEPTPHYIYYFLGTAMALYFLNLLIRKVSGRYTYL